MVIHRLAILCGLAFISTIFPCRADWSLTTVDSGASVGYAASLVLDTAGYPHISYFRPNTTMGFSDLYYATRTGATWSKESIVNGITNGTQGSTTSIATTELGTPAVSFTRSGTFVRYTIRSAGTWISPVDVSNAGGGFSSIVWQGTEAAPTPQVAFNDSAANDLRVAAMSAGTFSSQALDTSIAAGAYCSMAQVGSYMGVAYIDGSKLGFWQSLNSGMNWGAYSDNAFAPFTNTKAVICALALAPERNNQDPNSTAISAHILYFDDTTSRYYYETNDTATGVWATPELVYQSGLMTNISYAGCSIAVDSTGIIHVAFLDYVNKQLGYAKRTAGGWSAPDFIEGSKLGGAFCTIRLNAADQPCIAYAALVFNSGSMTYEPNGLRFAQFSSTSVPSTSGTPEFAISGKTKRITSKTSLLVKGTASAAAASIQWRVGKGKFRTSAVSGGAWSIKVTKLAVGKNVVQFRAMSAQGQTTAAKKVKITRQ